MHPEEAIMLFLLENHGFAGLDAAVDHASTWERIAGRGLPGTLERWYHDC
jgi:hypothetical protein